MKTVYLDNAATTSLDEQVLDAMQPFFRQHYANANSTHQLGQVASVAVEEAREKIAQMIGAEPSEIIFTSGGTESDNAALKGTVQARKKNHVITSRIEHHAVLHPAQCMKRHGITLSELIPDKDGVVSAEKVAGAITDDTALVSLMLVNNEIGAINPLAEISQICKEKGIPLHTDAVQAFGKMPINVDDMGIDLMSVSGHKFYGPKGVGFLYVRGGTPWYPFMEGGSQERRRRGGTLNVPGIVGLGVAAEFADQHMQMHQQHVSDLRKRMIKELKLIDNAAVSFNSDEENGFYTVLNASFTTPDGYPFDGEMLLLNLDMEGICVSSGSACTSGAIEPSHVLVGIGVDPSIARSSLRFSFSKYNTMEDIDYTVERLQVVLDRMMKTPA